jgi:hypothetical protein
MGSPAGRRNTVDGILDEVAMGGRIRRETLDRLIALLERKTDYHFHIELAVLVPPGALLKTLDNERDALETIHRLEGAPDKVTGIAALPSTAPPTAAGATHD